METTRGNADAITLIEGILNGAERIANMGYGEVRSAADANTRQGLIEIATAHTADVVEVRSITGEVVSQGTLVEVLTDWASINNYGPAIERLITLHTQHLKSLHGYQRWYREQGWLESDHEESDERRAVMGESTDAVIRYCRMLIEVIPTVWPLHLVNALAGAEKELAIEMNQRGGPVPIAEFAVKTGWSTEREHRTSLRDSAGGVRSRFNQTLERLKIDARISCADGEFGVVEIRGGEDKKK